MCTASTLGSASTSSYFVYRLANAEVIADLLQLALGALADGVHLGVGMVLVDRDELGPETETDDRHADFFRVCHASLLLRPIEKISQPVVAGGGACARVAKQRRRIPGETRPDYNTPCDDARNHRRTARGLA